MVEQLHSHQFDSYNFDRRHVVEHLPQIVSMAFKDENKKYFDNDMRLKEQILAE